MARWIRRYFIWSNKSWGKKTIIDRLEYLKSKDDNIVDQIRYELKNIFFQEDLLCKVEGIKSHIQYGINQK